MIHLITKCESEKERERVCQYLIEHRQSRGWKHVCADVGWQIYVHQFPQMNSDGCANACAARWTAAN